MLLAVLPATGEGLSANCGPEKLECIAAEQPSCKPEPWAVNQIGLSLEQRFSFADGFLYVNQLIKKHWFYEFRLVGIYNWIVNNPPKESLDPPPHPLAKDERNQWGWGGVGIFGYVFDVCDNVTVMPFFRIQAFKNASFSYKDKFHNRVDAKSIYYFGGLRLNMKVNDVFSMYTQYFGGYFRANFHGKRYFAKTSPAVVPAAEPPLRPRKHAHINGLSGVLEIGFPYKLKCNFSPCCKESTWLVAPYFQFIVHDNNIDYVYTVAPYSLNPLTTSSILFGVKMGREF